jgi:probable rRNA maturation factor
MKVILVNSSHKSDLTPKFYRSVLGKISRHFATKKIRNRKMLTAKAEVTVVLLSSAEMKSINFRFRKKNKTTDILSFAAQDPKSLGELLLCTEVLKKQAREQGHSLERETAYMLIHGVLHLLGYDHELSKAEEKLMFGLQEKCFKAI